MQSRVAQVGPLVASSATKIAASQTAAAAGYLALNGPAATGGNAANNICLSQSGTAATALLLNGSTSQTQFTPFWTGLTGAMIAVYNGTNSANILPNGSPIYITSAGDDHAHTFAVVGTGLAVDGTLGVITETITGTNASICASANVYKTIISITPSANTTSTVTVGWMGYVKLDVARQVLITDGGSDTGITFKFFGTDWSGSPISETVTGGASTTVTTLSYLTVTQIKASGATASTVTVGTNGVAYSPWINADTWASGALNCQAVVSGTVSYTIQTSNDDPNSVANPVAINAMTWDSTYAGITGATASASFGLAQVPLWIRILMTSNTNPGYVRLTANQALSVPY